MPGLGAQQDEDLCHRVFFWGSRGGDVRLAERVRGVSDELCRHLSGRQNKVHQAGGDGAVRHPVVFGGFGLLRHDHAALALDRPHPQSAVAAGAGEHDADGALMLILGQGAEEEVDGQALAVRRGRLQQMQRAVQEGHVAVGRDDVGAVGSDRHPVLDLEDLHLGVAPDQVGEDALVRGGQVLDEDEGHVAVGVGGHGGEEGFKGRQPSGRGADAHHGKACAGSFNRPGRRGGPGTALLSRVHG